VTDDHVQITRTQSGNKRIEVSREDLYSHEAGITHHACDRGGKQAPRCGRQCSNSQALLFHSRALNGVNGVCKARKSFRRAIAKYSASNGENDRLLASFDQWNAQLELEFLQGSVDGGMGNIHRPRSLHEAVVTGNLKKSSKVAEAYR
jgi:hypothetical protein